MNQVRSRTVASRSILAPVAWSATALLSLILLLTAMAAHAAASAKDSDVLGRWIADRNQPAMDYSVTAGPGGRIVVAVPAKAVGRAKAESITLDPVGPGSFSTPKGGKVRASFIVTAPRHAEFKMMINRPDAFNLTDQLLERP